MSEPYAADLESGLESSPLEDSSTAKVLADYAAMSKSDAKTKDVVSSLPSPALRATSPATGRGDPLPLPVAGEGRGEGLPREIGGRDGPEPTRFGDWEKAGRCIDF